MKKLFIAVPVYGAVEINFVKSMQRLLFDEPPCSMELKYLPGDSLVPRARNVLTADFLESDCTHLLFIDSDLIFSREHIERLMGFEEEVVGGFYPKKQGGPVQWVCNRAEKPPPPREDGLQEVRYMGTGFLRIERCVFERMIERYGNEIRYKPDHAERVEYDFWSVGTYPVGAMSGAGGAVKRYLSEDWYFCQRWLDLGGKVWGDTRTILKHVGQAIYPLPEQIKEFERPIIPEFLKREVEEYWIPNCPEPRTVLDIGANVGAFAVAAAKRWPQAKIFAYEPMPESVAELRKNCAGLDVTIEECGVRSFDGVSEIHVGENSVRSSFHGPTRTGQNGETITVLVRDAAGLPEAEFVKIDTEGCELEILSRLNLSSTKALACEYHFEHDKAPIILLCESAGLLLEESIDRRGPSRSGQQYGILKFLRKQ